MPVGDASWLSSHSAALPAIPVAGPGIIAHRGVALEAPENTLPAVQKAIELGCAMAEIDLRYTSDGEVILMHDGTLERTTNGAGRVSGTSLARVRQLDASARFPGGFAATKVPTLRETINWREERSSSTSI